MSCKRQTKELVRMVCLQFYSMLEISWHDFHRNSSRQNSVSVCHSVALEWCRLTVVKSISSLLIIHFEHVISWESEREREKTENKLQAALHTNRKRNIFTSTGSISLVLNMARRVELGINASRREKTTPFRSRSMHRKRRKYHREQWDTTVSVPTSSPFRLVLGRVRLFRRNLAPAVHPARPKLDENHQTKKPLSTNFSGERVHRVGRFGPIGEDS